MQHHLHGFVENKVPHDLQDKPISRISNSISKPTLINGTYRQFKKLVVDKEKQLIIGLGKNLTITMTTLSQNKRE